MLNADPLGYPVTVSAGGLAFDGTQAVDLPEPPPAPVVTERHGAVTIITVNRPQVRNAFDLATANAMERAINAFEADPRQRVAIVTGAGGYFSAGMDLKAAARGEMPITEGRGPLGIAGKPPVKPMIAAVEGPALAGGCELALCADLIVASRESVFGLPEPKRGLVAAAGGVLRLGQRLPLNLAMELVLTGEPMPAERLHEFGLVNRVTEPGRALAVAIELAEQIVGNAPLSVAIGKQILTESRDWTNDAAFDQQLTLAGPIGASEDAAEGIRAFAEKRDPVWAGR
jgi:acetyl-CoA C-acetyltransferase